jgi:sarcosine oxidase subunit alpha
MHHRHLELGAVMAESRGWQRPSRYGSVASELERIRDGVGLFDMSPSGKLAIQGTDIDSLFGSVFADVGPIEIGRLRVQLFGEVSDLQTVLMLRLAEDEAMVLTEPDEVHSVYEALRSREDGCAHTVDVTSALAGVRVTGPSAPSLLATLTELDVSPESFSNMSCAQTRVAEIHGTLLRADLAGELNYDLYVERDYGEYVWETALEAGEPLGATPYGTEAMSRL